MNCQVPLAPSGGDIYNAWREVATGFERLSAMAFDEGRYQVRIIDNLAVSDDVFEDVIAPGFPRRIAWEADAPGHLSAIAQALLVANDAFWVSGAAVGQGAHPALAGIFRRHCDEMPALIAVPVRASLGRVGGVLFQPEASPATDLSRDFAAFGSILAHEARRVMLAYFEYHAGLAGHSSHGRLSPREVQCIRLIAEGMTDDQVAEALNISRATVRYHLTNLCDKIEANSRTNAVYRAGALGLLPPL